MNSESSTDVFIHVYRSTWLVNSKIKFYLYALLKINLLIIKWIVSKYYFWNIKSALLRDYMYSNKNILIKKVFHPDVIFHKIKNINTARNTLS